MSHSATLWFTDVIIITMELYGTDEQAKSDLAYTHNASRRVLLLVLDFSWEMLKKRKEKSRKSPALSFKWELVDVINVTNLWSVY